MIKNSCYTSEYIKAKQAELRADPVLLEKAIYAFSLLFLLTKSNLNFVFKGGTSLLLHLPKPQRLSIDIDIVCNDKDTNIDKELSNIAQQDIFNGLKESQRGERGLPKRRHFKFFYNSNISPERGNYVLLDIIEDDCTLPTISKVIKSILFDSDGKDISVVVPTIEGLLGDKLTDFAPNTDGVPFKAENGNNMTMQVVKQLFDIGQLFDAASDFKLVMEAYRQAFLKENFYRNSKFCIEDSLNDTANTALELCKSDLKGYTLTSTVESLKNGINKISSHLMYSKFRLPLEAKTAAAKAFFLSRGIHKDTFKTLSDHGLYKADKQQIEFIRSRSIDLTLDRLKTVNPEAFYYLLLGNLV